MASTPSPHRSRRQAALAVLAAILACRPGAATAAEGAISQRLASSARQTVERLWSGTQDVAMFALGMIGIDYRWGGTHPEKGFDCSGLVQYVFHQVTGVSLPRTAEAMSRVGQPVAAANLQVGDLVFFNTRRFQFSHVGIYLGEDRFIHAPTSGGSVEVVRMSENYWQRKFNGARRLVGVLPDLIPPAIAAVSAPEVDAVSTPGPPFQAAGDPGGN